MVNDTIFIQAIKEGFWYKDGDTTAKASPSTDTYFITYTCKEDSEYYNIPNEIVMKFATPWRSDRLFFTVNNYGKIWALTREELL